MSMLHTVNKSPFERETLNTCLRYALPGSSILLIEDAVYAAREGTAHSDAIKNAIKDKSVYALKPDLDARGVNNGLINGVKLIDYAGFVELAASSQAVQSWL